MHSSIYISTGHALARRFQIFHHHTRSFEPQVWHSISGAHLASDWTHDRALASRRKCAFTSLPIATNLTLAGNLGYNKVMRLLFMSLRFWERRADHSHASSSIIHTLLLLLMCALAHRARVTFSFISWSPAGTCARPAVMAWHPEK